MMPLWKSDLPASSEESRVQTLMPHDNYNVLTLSPP